MGVLSVLWSALNQPNPGNGYSRQTSHVHIVDADAERRSVEAEALEAVLGEIVPEQVAERAAERWVASIPDRAAFELRVADLIAEKYETSGTRAKNCKKKGG